MDGVQCHSDDELTQGIITACPEIVMRVRGWSRGAWHIVSTQESQALEGLIPPEGMQPLAADQLFSEPQIRFFLKMHVDFCVHHIRYLF